MKPLRSLSPRERRRLMVALSMLCGIEALIVAKEVCGCTPAEAEATSRWAAPHKVRVMRDTFNAHL